MFPSRTAKLFSVIFVLSLAGVASSVEAATITLSPSADTTLSQASPDNNFGAEPLLSSGLTDDAAINRAFLKFDVASYIRSNATIQSATLILTVPHSVASQASAFGLHRVLQGWGEGTKAGGGAGGAATSGEATWYARFYPAPLWSVAGSAAPGDYVATASAIQFVTVDGSYAFSSSGLIATVQSWLTNSASNFGWTIISEDEADLGTAQSFASREDTVNAPKLIIEYTQPSLPQVSLPAAADTTLLENDPENNLGAADLIAGALGSSASGKRSRALIRFDIEGFPLQSVLTAAALDLTSEVFPGDDGQAASYFDLHRMLRPWQEGNKGGLIGGPADAGETTWSAQYDPAILWSVPGAGAPGDFSPAVSSRTFISGYGSYTFTNLLADVLFWQAHPEQNFGWILISEGEATQGTAKRFGSREETANAPRLRLEYLPFPKIERGEVVGNHFILSFVAQAGQAYSVQYRDFPTTGQWLTFTNPPPSLVVQTNVVTAPFACCQRFYRITAP